MLDPLEAAKKAWDSLGNEGRAKVRFGLVPQHLIDEAVRQGVDQKAFVDELSLIARCNGGWDDDIH